MARSKKLLIIPTEIKSRDLYGRLYLGQKAVKRGYTVLIGDSSTLHKQPLKFPRGLIFEDDVTFQCRHFMKMATQLGFGIVTTDEESIAVTSDDRYVMQRVHYPNLEKALLHFTRSEGDKNAILAQKPANSDICPLIPAGNARLDLLRESNIDFTTAEAPHDWNPDDVIVVMSRFSRSNPFSVTREQMRIGLKKKFDFTDEQFADFCKYLDHTDSLFDHFHPMAAKIPEMFPDKIVVFRPHPSENHKFWQDIADRYENAHCIHKGTATQWAINARAIVHTGCTTAIESALLGANVLAYCPITSKDYDVSMANIVSTIYDNADNLYAALENLRAPDQAQRRANAQKAREYLSQNVAGCLDQESTDIVLDAIDALNWQAAPLSPTQIIEDGKWHLRLLRDRLQRQFGKKKGGLKRETKEDYQKQKFPDTDMSEITRTLEKFGVEDIKVTPYTKNWWQLEA